MFKPGDSVVVVCDNITGLAGRTGTIYGEHTDIDDGYFIKFDLKAPVSGPFHSSELEFSKETYLDQFYALLTETR